MLQVFSLKWCRPVAVFVCRTCFRGYLPGWWPDTPRVWGTSPSSPVWAPPGRSHRPAVCPECGTAWGRPPEPAASSELAGPSALPAEVWATLSGKHAAPASNICFVLDKSRVKSNSWQDKKALQIILLALLLFQHCGWWPCDNIIPFFLPGFKKKRKSWILMWPVQKSCSSTDVGAAWCCSGHTWNNTKNSQTSKPA